MTIKERAASFIARKMLPKRVLYHAAIEVVCTATSGRYSNTVVPEITAMEAIGRFGKKNKI